MTTKYTSFWTECGVFIKEGVATDYTSQETLVEPLRFRSSKTGEEGWTTLKAYTERMGADQKVIYYVLGESLDRGAQPASGLLPPARPRGALSGRPGGRLDGEQPARLQREAAADRGRRQSGPAPPAETEAAEPTVGQEAFDQLAGGFASCWGSVSAMCGNPRRWWITRRASSLPTTPPSAISTCGA